jgi:hypothetical protein
MIYNNVFIFSVSKSKQKIVQRYLESQSSTGRIGILNKCKQNNNKEIEYQ